MVNVKNEKPPRQTDTPYFLKRAKERYGEIYSFPFIESEYESTRSKITIKCNKCGHETKRMANDFLHANVCKNCKKIEKKKKEFKSYEEISSMAKGNCIKPFDGVKNIKTDSVIAICEKHGEYEVKISSVLNNQYKCIKCIGEKSSLPYSVFVEKLEKKFPNKLTPFSDEYKNTSTKLHFKCNECGCIFERKPNVFLCGKLTSACPECGKKTGIAKRTKTTEEFIKDAIQVWGDEKFDFSDTVYEKSDKKVRIKCNECGRTFEIEANCFLGGVHGCPYHNCNSSIKEKEIAQFINSIGIECLTNDRRALDGKELDIFVPRYNIGIEFDGVFWHNELNKSKSYHLDKTKYCQDRGIRLIHIFEDEWIHKKEIWKSMLKNIFGKTDVKIYARKCQIVEVNYTTAKKFLEENHIQGNCQSKYRYGLMYENELVSLMAFGKTRHFIGNGLHEYELLRFCNKLNTNVIGGASKLFSYFIKQNNPSNIVSYADRRWSVGKLYEVLGFNLYNISKPNYFYVINDRRQNRFNFRKSVLVKKYNCPENMSESEFCKMQRWWRIYDCGALCYEWKNNA